MAGGTTVSIIDVVLLLNKLLLSPKMTSMGSSSVPAQLTIDESKSQKHVNGQ
jgi:hypothetical protein